MKLLKPRVTDVLKKVGISKDFTGIDPFYADRGRAVHACIELYLKGTLDESSVDEVCRPYFDGFLKFWDKFKFEPFTTELHLENDDYQGTIDLLSDHGIYDWKCSKSHDRAAEIQGAGYKKLAKSNFPFRVVQFPGDGSYKVFEYKAPIELWDCVWKLYQWKIGK